ncbi:MAG: glycosyltransferase family 9 protein [Weeksellaceae bacterium]|nr:glycosyltransferase family 9 protein [Weeksellaceae bacterium]
MKQKKCILVIRFSSMGDVAMSVPVVREFLQQNKGVELVFVSQRQFAPMFDSIPGLNFIGVDLNDYKGLSGLYRLSKELNKTDFEAVADLHNVLRTKIIRKFLKSNKAAVLDKGRKERRALIRQKNKIRKQLRPMPERYADVFRKLGFELRLSNRLKNNAVRENAVGIAPFALYEGKTYPLEQMKIVALKIAEKGTKVYLFGSKQENEQLKDWEQLHPNIVSVAGKYNLKKELEIMSGLKLMVSMDSANMHLASMVGTRTISIWGNTHPFMGFLGYGQQYIDVIQDETMEERPVSVFGRENTRSVEKDFFKNISPELIISRIEKYLNKNTD